MVPQVEGCVQRERVNKAECGHLMSATWTTSMPLSVDSSAYSSGTTLLKQKGDVDERVRPRFGLC